MIINWTPKAKKTFIDILNWLSVNWKNKETNKFINQTEDTIEQIKNNPYLYQASEKNEQIRRGIINHLVSLYYRIKPPKKEIDLLTFWDNRQNPTKNKFE